MLGAAREHRAAAVTLVPSALGRTFTLLEFARLIQEALPGPLDLLGGRGAGQAPPPPADLPR